MMQAAPVWVVALATLAFGLAGYLAIRTSARVCATIEPFDDGPVPGRPPSVALVLGAAAVGGLVTAQVGLGLSLAISAIAIVALVASWYSDVTCGIIPDAFTLVPLALVLALTALGHDWLRLVMTVAVATPFALAALISHGRGMGWGDVKLVALGAAVLEDRSILAFGAACLAAVVVATIRNRRREPIAFAPYLAGAIALTMALPVFPKMGL